MKTKYFGVAAGEQGSREKRAEFRETARMHLLAFTEAMEQQPVKPIAVGFKPGTDTERGYLFLTFSPSEQVRFYVSPGHGRYTCDKIDFVYMDAGAGVLFEMTPQPWARALFDDMERTGAVDDHIATAQGMRAN